MKTTFRTFNIAFFILLSQFVFGQTSLKMQIGYGLEGGNFGISYLYQRHQIGVSYSPDGFFSSNGGFVIKGDYFLHFGRTSRKSGIRPWYFGNGISFQKRETEYWIYKETNLNSRIGREIYFTKNLGFGMDLGAYFHLNQQQIKNKPNPYSGNGGLAFDFWIMPGFGLYIFYRI